MWLGFCSTMRMPHCTGDRIHTRPAMRDVVRSGSHPARTAYHSYRHELLAPRYGRALDRHTPFACAAIACWFGQLCLAASRPTALQLLLHTQTLHRCAPHSSQVLGAYLFCPADYFLLLQSAYVLFLPGGYLRRDAVCLQSLLLPLLPAPPPRGLPGPRCPSPPGPGTGATAPATPTCCWPHGRPSTI